MGIRRECFDLIVRIDAIGRVHEDQRPGEIARVEAKVAACGRSGACHAVQRQRDAGPPSSSVEIRASGVAHWGQNLKLVSSMMKV